MTRINQTLASATLAIMLASTGCGDAGSFEETGSQDSSRIADDAGSAGDMKFTLGDELQLACEAYCDAATSCRRALFPEDCTEHCADERRPDADDACVAAEIELMNCYSPTSCDASPEELRIECGDAMLEFRTACSRTVPVRELIEDGELEVIEREPADDREPEEIDPSEEPGDEEPGESEDSGPVFELPEIPDFPYFPEPGVLIELP